MQERASAAVIADEAAVPNFDFIASKPFRESLECDYADMLRCRQAGAWKSVQVLSGSIVEALLVDYLVTVPNATRAAKDPLRLDLGEAVAICRAESVISERTGNLCSVVRSYRNLIHPGRAVRLNEQPADAKSAAVAVALVDMIADEVARVRRATQGLTAEQIVSKIKRDASSLTILKHLLLETSLGERERLLVDLLPNTYMQLWETGDDDGDYLIRLEQAYPIVFDHATDEARCRVAAAFVQIIRTEDGHRVEKYGDVFFRPNHLNYVEESQRPIVREHLLGRVPTIHTRASLHLIDGIETFLAPEDVGKWLEPLLRTLLSPAAKAEIQSATQEHLLWAAMDISPAIGERIDKRLDWWEKRYEDNNSPELADRVRAVKKLMQNVRVLA